MQKIKTDKMLSQLGRIGDEKFKVLFFIYNTFNMNSDHTNRVKIYRAVLADLTGKSVRTISRITDNLAEDGLIIKDNVSDGSNLYNYYSIPKHILEGNLVTDCNKTDANLVTDGRVKGPKALKEQKEQKAAKAKKAAKELETAETDDFLEMIGVGINPNSPMYSDSDDDYLPF